MAPVWLIEKMKGEGIISDIAFVLSRNTRGSQRPPKGLRLTDVQPHRVVDNVDDFDRINVIVIDDYVLEHRAAFTVIQAQRYATHSAQRCSVTCWHQ